MNAPPSLVSAATVSRRARSAAPMFPSIRAGGTPASSKRVQAAPPLPLVDVRADQRTAGRGHLGFQQCFQRGLGGAEHVHAEHVPEHLIGLDLGDALPGERLQADADLQHHRLIHLLHMHDTATVENVQPPSREADAADRPPSPEPPYLEKLFGLEPAVRPLPPPVGDLVDEIVELAGAEPTAVAAVAFATLLATVGPRVKLQRARSRHALGFNLVVSHQAPRTLPWFDALTAPFVGRVFDLQRSRCHKGAGKLQEAIARQTEELERVMRTVAPDNELVTRLRQELDRAPAHLKPNVASSNVEPKELSQILADCFDGGVTLTGLGNDPGADLLRLKVPARARLAETLNRSWDGTPLVLGRAIHEAHLSLLWQTREPLNALLGPRGFQPEFVPVPILLLADDSRAQRIETFSCEAGWNHLCGEIFNIRCLNRETVFTLHAEAEAALGSFTGQIAKNLGAVPVKLRGAVDWLPDLAARLSGLFWILTARKETTIEKLAVVEAIKTTKWLGRRHLLAAAIAIAPVDTADSADKKPALLAKIRSKAPITRRELRRCFDDQHVRWFDEALDALIEGKKVCYDDGQRLVVCP